MTTSVSQYLNLVPSENKDKPNFTAVLTAILTPFCENIDNAIEMQTLFDVDTAVGQQLDFVGQWIGVGRIIVQASGTPITLDDTHYRLYLYAAILRNRWDGTIPNAYAIWATLATGFSMVIIDNQDMTMLFGLTGGTPDADTLALLQGGFLTPRPAGVLSLGYFTYFPLFGLDTEDSFIAGFDVGYIV